MSLQVTQDYNAAFTGVNAAMIDYYGQQNFKAFTDCGLDLGWSHPNASNFPNWPADDCYHTCNTGCTSTLATNTTAGGTTTGGGSTGSTKSSNAYSLVGTMGAVTTLALLSTLLFI